MMKRTTGGGSPLKGLPDGFDRSVIVMPDRERGRKGRSVHLCKSDYAPLDRRHFTGHFALRNIAESSHRFRAEIVADAMASNGGRCEFVLTKSGKGLGSVTVHLLDAWIDREYVVVHIEPWKEA